MNSQFDTTFHGHGQPEPIGLEYIAAGLVEAGFNCRFEGCFELHVESDSSQKQLALFSGITSEFAEIVKTAKVAKQRGEITVLGGYHACGNADNIERDIFDYIVVGEGEEVAIALANAILCDESSELVSFQDNDNQIIRAPRIKHLDSLPFPLRSEERMSRYQYHLHDLMWPPASQQYNSTLVLASRGCSNNCDFCASATVWGRGVRFRSPDNIIEELVDIKTRFGTNTLVFIDQSLGQAKQWTVELCNAIQEADIGMNWYHQSNLDIDLDVIEEMAKAGCTKIGFGLEGISPYAMENIKPINPRSFDAINDLFAYCNSLGIFVKTYLMIGFPWETEKIIEGYYEWIAHIRANQIKISYMTPFPGTRDWDKYSGNLISRNWTDFDTVSMPVVYNPNITVEQYHEIRNQLFLNFYDSPTYTETTHHMLKGFPHYIDSYKEFVIYLRKFNMISGHEEWLKLLNHENSKQVIPGANFQG